MTARIVILGGGTGGTMIANRLRRRLDEREASRALDAYDIVTVPLHGGAAYVGRSEGLGDALGFVPTDPRTLQSLARPNVFALGDATNLPISKAGSVTHFEGETLAENLARFLAGREPTSAYDGHANCVTETGLRQGAYACHASVEMSDLEDDDFVPQVDGILTVGEFSERSAGAQVIFTWAMRRRRPRNLRSELRGRGREQRL